MRVWKGIARSGAFLLFGIGIVWSCAFDSTLRAYLHARFWLPLSKNAGNFGRGNVRRVSAPFAGMIAVQNSTPLGRLRAAYQQISNPDRAAFDFADVRKALQAARADSSLSPHEREEIELIDAKIDLREGEPGEEAPLRSAREKLQKFLNTARTPEFLSEARGWLARVHLLLGDQVAAGKIYLDELNRDGSNLSEETVRNSLRITYGHDGGQKLRDQLEEYFDTPQHAAFAIQLATNPSWNRYERDDEPRPDTQAVYQRMQTLLKQHAGLLKSEDVSNALAMLSMRTALRMGDPPGALAVARMVPEPSALRDDPDFHWMLASAYFLSHEFAAAEKPLLALFRSPRAAPTQRAAAAYGLCGVYKKNKNVVEQLHFALWLWHAGGGGGWKDPFNTDVYWAASGWDAGLLLDTEASIEDLMAFLDKYPKDPESRLVKYSLAVRLTRENRYDEAAQIYESIRAIVRAPRTRHLAALFAEGNRTDLPNGEAQEAKFRLAEFIAGNANRIYFNDALWSGLQRYVLDAGRESGFTKEEREAALAEERRLKDEQEEYWRAYLILRDVVRDSGNSDVGQKAAALALRCLRRINTERFGREEEIRRADVELSRLRARRNSGQGSVTVR